MKFYFLLGLAIFGAAVTQVQAASFDCSKAGTATEIAICSNAELNLLDEQLSEAYQWLQENGEAENLDVSQSEWLQTRNDCTDDVDCLGFEMRYRLIELRTGDVYRDDQLQFELPILSETMKRELINTWATCENEGQMDLTLYNFDAEMEYIDDPQSYLLLGTECSAGAYNFSTAWLVENIEYEDVTRASFAYPDVDFSFDSDDITNDDRQVVSYKISGFMSRAGNEVVNATFDPVTLQMYEYVKFRGLGDSYSMGTWRFDEGDFKLIRYEIDPTYDGEMNGFTVFDAEQFEVFPVQ